MFLFLLNQSEFRYYLLNKSISLFQLLITAEYNITQSVKLVLNKQHDKDVCCCKHFI